MNKEKIIILILASINFTHIMDFMIMMPLGPQLMRIFKIDAQEFSLLVSAYTFSAGFSGFVAAFFVDKFDRKFVLLFGYVGFVVGTFACALAPTYELLLLARVLAGLFGGLISAQVMSIIGDLIPFERRGAAMGTLTTAFSVASVAGVPFALYFATKLSWHAPFVFIAGIGALIIPLIYTYIPVMKNHIQQKGLKSNPFAVINHIVADGNQQRGILLMILLMIGHFSIVSFMSPYMVANVGFTEGEVAYIYFVGGAFSIFSSPMVGKLADKYGKFQTLSIFIVLSCLPIFLITNMPRVPIYYALMATALFFVFAGGRFIPAQAMITAVVPPQQRGGYMSIVSSVQQLASGSAALLGGFIIIEKPNGELLNYHIVGYIGITASLICIVIARSLRTYEQQNQIILEKEKILTN